MNWYLEVKSPPRCPHYGLNLQFYPCLIYYHHSQNAPLLGSLQIIQLPKSLHTNMTRQGKFWKDRVSKRLLDSPLGNFSYISINIKQSWCRSEKDLLPHPPIKLLCCAQRECETQRPFVCYKHLGNRLIWNLFLVIIIESNDKKLTNLRRNHSKGRKIICNKWYKKGKINGKQEPK